MQTEVKEIGPCKVQIKIEMPPEKIKEKLEAKYTDFAASATVPGFRKGLAPRSLIERKFGKDIRDEVKNDLIIAASSDVFKEKNLKPVADPQIDFEKIVLDETKPLAFEMVVEVEPTVNVAEYTGIKVKKVAVEVTDKDIDNALEAIRNQHGEWQVLAKEKSKKGDMLVFSQETFVDGKRVHNNENSTMIIGQDVKFFGKPSADIGNALGELKAGDSKDIKIKVPDDAEKPEYRGKEAVLKISVKEVKRIHIPKLTEEWAKQIGFDSLDKMKEEVKKRLAVQKEKEAEYKMENQVLDTILEKNNFQLPEVLVNEGVDYLLRRWTTQMIMEGMPEKEIAADLENLKAKAKDAAEKDIRIQFIADHIAKNEKIFVTEDEVNQRINELAGRYRKWPNEIRKYYEENNMMGQLRTDIREEKVRKLLREKAVVTD
ncbi:MAG: trigger factor [Planctomycetota bacterium]